MLISGNMPGERGGEGWNKAEVNNSEWKYLFFDRGQLTEGAASPLREQERAAGGSAPNGTKMTLTGIYCRNCSRDFFIWPGRPAVSSFFK